MATENILDYALKILKERATHYTECADKATSHTVKQMALSEASAYDSAWWVLHYAIHEQWDCLKQFDYINESEG